MKTLNIRIFLVSLVMAVSAPAFADRDDHWGHGRHGRHHHRDHDHDRGHYRDDACRYKSWYDHNGNYHERRVCRDSRYQGPRAAVMMAPQALVLQPPAVYIQPPGIFVR